MKIRKTIKCGSIQTVAILAAFVFAQPVMAECIQSVSSEGIKSTDTSVLSIDANNGCANIQGMEGCTIDRDLGDGTCTYIDPINKDDDGNFLWFTVYSSFHPDDGSLTWLLDEGSTITATDAHVTGGGSKGKNNCGYIHKFDVKSGSGGDCKAALDADGNCTGTFQNFTSLDVCTDGKQEEAPPPVPEAIPLATCGDPTEGELLDYTGIICPANGQETVVCNFEKAEYAWGTVGANEKGEQEEVCCRCNPPDVETVTACFVADNAADNTTAENTCATTTTIDLTQSVVIELDRIDGDPCTKIVSGGKVYKTCWKNPD